MPIKIVLKGRDIYINRIHVPAHVVQAVNFMVRRAPGLAFLGDNLITEFIVEAVPGLEEEEAECLAEATALAIQGHQDRFDTSLDVLNTLADGKRKVQK